MNHLQCKHGIPMAPTGNGFINACGFCKAPRTVFSMPSPGERYINGTQVFLTEEEEQTIKDETHERDLFRHWDHGEAQIAQMAHIDSMRPLDRLIVEGAVASSEKVNRINYAGVEDRRPYFDRLDTLARFMRMVDDFGKVDPLAETILQSFRTLELNERDRRRIAAGIAADHTRIDALIESAVEVSKEVIPPYPTDIADQDLQTIPLDLLDSNSPIDYDTEETETIEITFTDEIGPIDQGDLYATPIGHAEGDDYMTSKARSAKYRAMFTRLALAVQADDGKALAQVGKDIHAETFIGLEKGVLFHMHKVATGKVAHHLRHRVDALLRWIEGHPKPQAIGKQLYKLNESANGRPRLTSQQWGTIWEAYRARVPKRPAPEQAPLFEPPAF